MSSPSRQSTLVPIFIAAVLWGSTPAAAQLARRGGELRINQTSIVRTFGSRVAGTPDGGFIITWDNEGGDGAGWGVFARLFDVDGNPESPEFRVSSTITGDQLEPHLAVANDGSFAIVWTTEPFGEGQVFGPDGAPRGSQITFAEPEVNGPANGVAATGTGEFVVVLTDFIGVGYEIRARRVGADGELLAPSFAVSAPVPDTIAGQMLGDIATSENDAFLVVWYDERNAQMRARHFADGQPTAGEEAVGDVSNFFADAPRICGTGSGFVVTWTGDDVSPFDGGVVLYRLYNATGEPVGDPVRVTPQREMVSVGEPDVACGPNEEFVLAWGQDYEVAGQVSSGQAAAFRIAEALRPSVAMLSDEDFVMIWDTCRFDAPQCDVLAQQFTLTGPTDCAGDCDRNGAVTVAELVLSVNAALTAQPDRTRRCLPADTSLDFRITVDELAAAVTRLLRGCS
jgi:hypothetical protein